MRVTCSLLSPQMNTRPATPPASVVAGPSSLWRLADRRVRKAGSANIFSNVNLCQLQRLFRAAGDQDAEQRAQLIWGHSDETELAQALIGLRARSHKRGPRGSRRDVLGSHWLQAFNHLRYIKTEPRTLNRIEIFIAILFIHVSGLVKICQTTRKKTLSKTVIQRTEPKTARIHTNTTPQWC